MAEYYKTKGCPVHGTIHLNDKDVKLPKLGIDDDEFKDIAKSITKSTLIQPDLFVYTNNMLNKGLDSVFDDVQYDAPEYVKVQQMKRNLARFAGYKSAWQTANINNAKPEQYAAINNTYNNLYTKAEYVHTVRSARSAKNWQRYEADKDLYPYLEYMPSVSAEPRDEHKKLYGVIKPVDDSFWDTWMPPADWGCKCSVEQRRRDDNAQEPPEDIKLPPAAMRNNPGKSGEIITDKHPMIAKLSKEDKDNIQKEYQYLERKFLRKEYFLNAKKIKKIDNINISSRSIKKTLNDCDIMEWQILNELEYFLKNPTQKIRIKPLDSKNNILYSHFYKLKTNKELYAIVWETTDGTLIFHTIAYKIVGEII